MNETHIYSLKTFNGPPDLAVRVVPTKSLIVGGNWLDAQEVSTVTITVQNRFTFLPVPLERGEPNTLPAFGSDAHNVVVWVGLSARLHQIGNMSLPAGFQAAVGSNNQTIFFYGGTIPAGASVDFQLDVLGDAPTEGCFEDGSILAQVDPYSSITETDKTNNWARATITIWGCIIP